MSRRVRVVVELALDFEIYDPEPDPMLGPMDRESEEDQARHMAGAYVQQLRGTMRQRRADMRQGDPKAIHLTRIEAPPPPLEPKK